MDLGIPEERRLLARAAREFLERECPRTFVRDIDEGDLGHSPEFWGRAATLGWQGLLLPGEYGGQDGTAEDGYALFSELGRAAAPGPFLSSLIGALAILRIGTPSQRQQVLPTVATGERILSLAFTERGYRWSPDSIQTHALPVSDGFVLDGEKQFVPDGLVADQLIVSANLEGSEGLALFLVDGQQLERHPMRGFVGERLAAIKFDSTRIPADAILGGTVDARKELREVLDEATVQLCAYKVGVAERAYEIALGYAQTRVQFGQPIAKFTRVQDHFVEMIDLLDAARWTTLEAASKVSKGKAGVAEAVAVAKAVTSDACYQICEHAHHVHGGIGIDKRYGLVNYTRRSRSLYGYLGDPIYHRRRLAEILAI